MDDIPPYLAGKNPERCWSDLVDQLKYLNVPVRQLAKWLGRAGDHRGMDAIITELEDAEQKESEPSAQLCAVVTLLAGKKAYLDSLPDPTWERAGTNRFLANDKYTLEELRVFRNRGRLAWQISVGPADNSDDLSIGYASVDAAKRNARLHGQMWKEERLLRDRVPPH